jgi:alcohol dehydrogenase
MERFGLSRLPRITFGSGAVAELPGAVARHGRRCLLVTGGASFSMLGLDDIDERLAAHGVELAGRVRAPSEPGPDVVDAFAETARDLDADVVLGIGGGSVIDTAKSVAGLAHSGSRVMDHLEGVGRGIDYTGPALPFIAVPTTAGTGSEVTRNSVITVRSPGGFKRSFRDERLIAAEAIVDPDLAAACGPSLIAANGLDASIQLLEAYTSRRAGPVTDALALEGLAAARDGLLPWHTAPSGPGAATARARMAYAALLSGMCLANAGLGAVHGLAAPIGALLPITHGAACGALLVATTRANLERLATLGAPGADARERYARVGRLLAGLAVSTPIEEALEGLMAILETWTRMLDTPRLGALGLSPDHLDTVIAGVSTNSMSGNPVDLTPEHLESILRSSL